MRSQVFISNMYTVKPVGMCTIHYSDAILSAMVSQINDCLIDCLFRSRSKKTSKPRVTGLCVGILPVTGRFPSITRKIFPFDDVIMFIVNECGDDSHALSSSCTWTITQYISPPTIVHDQAVTDVDPSIIAICVSIFPINSTVRPPGLGLMIHTTYVQKLSSSRPG